MSLYLKPELWSSTRQHKAGPPPARQHKGASPAPRQHKSAFRHLPTSWLGNDPIFGAPENDDSNPFVAPNQKMSIRTQFAVSIGKSSDYARFCAGWHPQTCLGVNY